MLWSDTRLSLSCFLVVTPALVGCGGDDDMGAPDGGMSDGRVDRADGGSPAQLAYTPEGCGYEVRTPEVLEAGRMGTAVGASPAPQFVHASLAGPSDSSFAINWRTDTDTTISQIVYGTDEAMVAAADAASGDALLAEGHNLLFHALTDEDIRIHEVHVCGLTPSTTYYYKVGGPGAWSEVFDVGTGPTRGTADGFRFAVSGDSRNDAMVWARVQQAIRDQAPDLQIFSGDAVVLGANQPEWDGFFGQDIAGFNVQDSLARIPLMPTNGNHEGLAVNYVLQYALPQELSPSERAEGEEWYSFDYGNAHFVVLDDQASMSVIEGAEADWLRADLASVNRTTTPWIFAMHHHGAYSCSQHGSDVAVRLAWQPIYDEHQVDIVFNGHDHNYERSRPIRGIASDGTNDGVLAEAAALDGAPVDGSGTVYVVAGGAGAPLYDSGTCGHTHLSESTNNYAIVDLDDRRMTYTAYRLDGTMLDHFEYVKP